jgi:hypothetical protein
MITGLHMYIAVQVISIAISEVFIIIIIIIKPASLPLKGPLHSPSEINYTLAKIFKKREES